MPTVTYPDLDGKSTCRSISFQWQKAPLYESPCLHSDATAEKYQEWKTATQARFTEQVKMSTYFYIYCLKRFRLSFRLINISVLIHIDQL